MVRVVGRGWRSLYYIVLKNRGKCLKLGRYYRVITEMEAKPRRDPEKPSYYAVQLRCGWGPTHVPHLGGTVGGLTREQWLFLHSSTPKDDAIIAVGPVWPGLDEAIRRAEEHGVKVRVFE